MSGCGNDHLGASTPLGAPSSFSSSSRRGSSSFVKRRQVLSSFVKRCQGFPWPFRAFSRAYDAKVDKSCFMEILASPGGPRSPGADA
jgi:hypothetical protein